MVASNFSNYVTGQQFIETGSNWLLFAAAEKAFKRSKTFSYTAYSRLGNNQNCLTILFHDLAQGHRL